MLADGDGVADIHPDEYEDFHHLRLMALLHELVREKATVLKVKRNEQRMWKSCRAKASDA